MIYYLIQWKKNGFDEKLVVYGDASEQRWTQQLKQSGAEDIKSKSLFYLSELWEKEDEEGLLKARKLKEKELTRFLNSYEGSEMFEGKRPKPSTYE
jgi:hypothetical protein